jgi:hypothetical protein
MRIEEGSYDGEEMVSGVDFGQRRKTVMWPDEWGPHISGGRREAGYRFGKKGGWATGRLWCWARLLPPGPFYVFSSFFLFLFLFLISFISFANMTQIKPNHFHKFCRIHSKVLNQHQTCFQNQNKNFNKRS